MYSILSVSTMADDALRPTTSTRSCRCRRPSSTFWSRSRTAIGTATRSCRTWLRTDGKVRLSAGTLYSAIRRMLEQGLIEELRDSPDPASEDERRRYYRLTRLGREVAVAEARRFTDLLSQARATGLIPRKL